MKKLKLANIFTCLAVSFTFLFTNFTLAQQGEPFEPGKLFVRIDNNSYKPSFPESGGLIFKNNKYKTLLTKRMLKK